MTRGRAGEEVALRLACLERRVDPSPRLVLSDWLEERGRDAEAAAERAEAAKLAALPAEWAGPLSELWEALITDTTSAARPAADALVAASTIREARAEYAYRESADQFAAVCNVARLFRCCGIVLWSWRESWRYSRNRVWRRAYQPGYDRDQWELSNALRVNGNFEPVGEPQSVPTRLPAPVPGCARVDVLSGAAVTAYDWPPGEPVPDADGWRTLYYDCTPDEADRYHDFLAALDPPGWAVHLHHRVSAVVR